MKAWIVNCQDEWCSLVHADTAGKAKVIVRGLHGYDDEYIDYNARRFKQLDDKLFNHQICLDAGFEYLDDWHGNPIKPDEFINDCPCNICKGEK